MLKKAVNATSVLAKNLEKTILNQSRGKNDGIVGAGYVALNISGEGGELGQKRKSLLNQWVPKTKFFRLYTGKI